MDVVKRSRVYHVTHLVSTPSHKLRMKTEPMKITSTKYSQAYW